MRRAILLTGVVVLMLLLSACARLAAATPTETGQIEIVMTDYAFEPSAIRLKAGQTVTLVLRNEGDKMHEFMAGRDIQVHDDLTEGFGVDFFAGMMPQISGPGMVMGMPGMEMEGMDMGADEHAMEGDDMAGMDMSAEDEHGDEAMDMGDEHAEDEHADEAMDMGDEHAMEGEEEMADMPMGDEHAEDEHADEAMDMSDEHAMEGEGEMADMPMGDEHAEEMPAGEFGPFQRPLMDAHAGLMIMIDPVMISADQVTTVTFTVPADKVGTWEFGCFQEQGQHYDDGMHGTLIVES